MAEAERLAASGQRSDFGLPWKHIDKTAPDDDYLGEVVDRDGNFVASFFDPDCAELAVAATERLAAYQRAAMEAIRRADDAGHTNDLIALLAADGIDALEFRG